MMREAHRSGFTLIELLVVLAIVATLLLFSAPRYLGKLRSAREAVLQENLRAIRLVIGHFHGDNGRCPESLAELVARGYIEAPPIDPITESSSTWVLLPPPTGTRGQFCDLRSGAAGETLEGVTYSSL